MTITLVGLNSSAFSWYCLKLMEC